ncbi:MAG: hypothetical protein JNN03_12375 [Rubrivivax sp.]|nr:hypothetical protein [Rubrivivax sp.]
MKTSTTTRLVSFAAALLITFTTVQALASYGLPPVADTVMASACLCR